MPTIVDELEIGSNQVDPIRYPRPVISTLDTWDQHAQIDYHFAAPAIGRRPSWNVPSIAVTSEPINTIQQSVNTRFVTPNVPTPAGMFADPQNNGLVASFVPIPNMAQSLKVDSHVQIAFAVSLRSAQAPHLIRMAIFRDNQQISQYFDVTTTAVGSQVSGTGSYTDTYVRAGWHTYDLRWRTALVQVFADYKNRTFQVSNLRAQ